MYKERKVIIDNEIWYMLINIYTNNVVEINKERRMLKA